MSKILVIYADWFDMDWGRINHAISRGFTRLYPIPSDECPLGSKWGIICARPPILKKHAYALFRGNGHGGPRRRETRTDTFAVKEGCQ